MPENAPHQEDDPKEMADLFKGFVALVSNITMQQFGRVPNPVTHQVERNPDVACAWIETLRMIRAKTRGNLSSEEQQFIDSHIASLQMVYVEETGKGQTESTLHENPAADDTSGS